MLEEVRWNETVDGTTTMRRLNTCGVANMIQYDVANKQIWSFGDNTSYTFERTAKFDGNTNTFSAGVKLPEPLSKPCVVQIDDDTILVIGGESADGALKGKVSLCANLQISSVHRGHNNTIYMAPNLGPADRFWAKLQTTNLEIK